jgi:DNA-binding response OmpR family regulator
MKDKRLSFLVIENAPDVCEGIIRRMEKFEEWKSEGYCVGVKDSIVKLNTLKPDLLFLDWGLNGGSAFEVLQAVQNLQDYNPYIIFNTGFQKDNPEIPQEIINNYKVDKYLVKPLWENLRNNLPAYLKEAAEKANNLNNKSKIIWVDDEKGNKVPLELDNLICICQHPSNPRSRIFYINNTVKEINVPLQWNKCQELLQQNNIDYFVTKSRSHIIVRSFVEKFEKPFVRLRNFPAKIEVVKENIRAFENWLMK